jgi:hypothetical protein
MTRINLITPALLTNKQLLAEYRELPRIINRVAAGNKLWFLHIAIRKELGRRHAVYPDRFKGPYVICTKAAWHQAIATQPYECRDWTPSKRDILVAMGRLVERQMGYKTPDRWGDRIITPATVWQVWAQNVACVLGISDEVRGMLPCQA